MKIDRSFVRRLGAEDGGFPIVGGIAALSGALGLGVVAEGVETPEQAAEARSLGCGQAQGYYFMRPGPPEQIESVLGATEVDSGEGGIRTHEAAFAAHAISSRAP